MLSQMREQVALADSGDLRIDLPITVYVTSCVLHEDGSHKVQPVITEYNRPSKGYASTVHVWIIGRRILVNTANYYTDSWRTITYKSSYDANVALFRAQCTPLEPKRDTASRMVWALSHTSVLDRGMRF